MVIVDRESVTQKAIRLDVGKDPWVKLWRMQVGLFRRIFGCGKIRVGVKGMSDLIGYTSIIITPDMVGQRIAVFTVIETKTEVGRLSKFQRWFIEGAKKAGAFAGVARSVEDARRITRRG